MDNGLVPARPELHTAGVQYCVDVEICCPAGNSMHLLGEEIAELLPSQQVAACRRAARPAGFGPIGIERHTPVQTRLCQAK